MQLLLCCFIATQEIKFRLNQLFSVNPKKIQNLHIFSASYFLSYQIFKCQNKIRNVALAFLSYWNPFQWFKTENLFSYINPIKHFFLQKLWFKNNIYDYAVFEEAEPNEPLKLKELRMFVSGIASNIIESLLPHYHNNMLTTKEKEIWKRNSFEDKSLKSV